MNVYDEVNRLCDQWERTAPPLPPDARRLLQRLARRIVLEAAVACRGRVHEDKSPTANGEAAKCADQVTHNLLCREGEYVCYGCDGYGCERCGHWGTVLGKGAKP